MKKLLVITLAAMFVLGFSVLTMGAVKITGEVQSEYSFTDAEQNSSLELNFEAAVSSTVTAYAQVELEYEVGDVFDWDDADDDGEVDSGELTEESAVGSSIDLDEAYFKIKTGFGNLFVGEREVSLYTNEVLDENDSCWGDVMGAGVVAWEYAFSGGLYVNAQYSRYESGEFGYNDNWFDEGGYILGVGFKGSSWEVAYYHVNIAPDGDDPGYAFLFEIEPASWLKIYATFAVQTADYDDNADVGVIGAEFEFGNLGFAIDWDTVENADGFNPYGIKIEYALSNKVELEFTQLELKQGDFSQELEVKAEF